MSWQLNRIEGFEADKQDMIYIVFLKITALTSVKKKTYFFCHNAEVGINTN